MLQFTILDRPTELPGLLWLMGGCAIDAGCMFITRCMPCGALSTIVYVELAMVSCVVGPGLVIGVRVSGCMHAGVYSGTPRCTRAFALLLKTCLLMPFPSNATKSTSAFPSFANLAFTMHT